MWGTGVAAFLLAGCGGGSSLLLPGDGVANHIKISAGNNQSGRVGEPLTDPLVAQVTDSRGRPVQGVSVAFAFTSGAPGAEIDPSTATTDAKGEANAEVVLGTTIGPQTGEASIVTDGGTAPSTSFTLMAVPKDANGIAAESGDDQSGAAGSKLRQPLVVQVTDAFGNPISGVAIDWSAEGGGSVSDATNTTDDNGLASVERTLGPAAGKQTTQANSEGLAGSPVTFTHTATAGNASSLTIVSGNNQTATAGTKLPAALLVQLVDGEGNGVPNTAVTWVVGTGGGSVTPQNGNTDDQGRASAEWTLGPNPGENRVDAVVSGVGIANFTATGTSAGPIATTTTITSDSPDPSASGSPFTVEVRVTSPGPVPTGTVRVTADGAQANCTVTLQNGTGSCSLTLNAVGDRTLRATYSGATGLAGSSATAPHRVNPAQQQNRAPHADYNWTCTGLTCQFTDHSSDPDGDQTLASWSWNFGDGATSPDRNPTHTFPGAGSYLVALTVGDNAGGSNTATAHVDVHAPPPPPANKAPHAEFEVHCTDQTCSFTDRSSDDDGVIAGRHWDFGDGQSSTEQNPSHPYAAPGHYNVTLTVTDNGGATDFKTHDANPTAPPPPPPAGTTTSITNDDPDPSVQGVPFTVSFTVSSGSGVPGGTVTVSDGTDSCSGNLDGTGSGSCSLTLTTAGSRTLTATYPGNSSFAGSQDSASHGVNPPPTAAFTVPTDCTVGVACQFMNQSTDDGAISSSSWNFDDPDSGSDNTSVDQNPSHTFSHDGSFAVQLTVTDNLGATGTVSNQVTVATP